jgi:hypothetical protein
METQTTKDLDRLLPLTHEEQAICYAIEHNEHIHIAQALAYLHWARARGCALDAPYQAPLPTTSEHETLTTPALPELDAALGKIIATLDDEEGVLT